MNLKPNIKLFFLLSLWHFHAFSQQFTFQNFSVEDDLSQSQVYALLEDSRGYLWIGTQGGLDRFDGKNFKNFSRQEGLKDDFINALAEDSDGNIWIGTTLGLWKYDGWQFEKIRLKQFGNLKIISLLCDTFGQIWIGSEEGIFIIRDSEISHFSDEYEIRRAEIYSIFQDSKGVLWFGTNFGITKLSGRGIQQFSKNDGLPGTTVNAFSEDENGTVWASVFGVGLVRMVGKNSFVYESKSSKYPKEIQCMERGNEGEIWIGTFNRGLFIWNTKDSIFTQFTEKDGLAKKDVRAIKKDRWGNFWIGTSGGGISKYGGQEFIHFNNENGLPEEKIYAVCEDDFGRIWFSSYGKGVSVYNGTFFDHLGEDHDSLRFTSKSIFKDKIGNIWIGTEKKGLVLYKENRFHFLSQFLSVPIINVRDILEDSSGNIWVGTMGSGILKIKPNLEDLSQIQVTDFTTNTGLPSNRIVNLHLDTLNRIWFATRSLGLGLLEEKEENRTVSRRFLPKDGLVSRQIRALAEDSTGYLWAATPFGLSKLYLYGDSLFVSKDENSEKLTRSNLYLIGFDSENNLWAGSQKGVEKCFLDKNRNISDTKFFGKNEGFLGIETCMNAFLKDRENNLWFGTMNGLTKYQSGVEIASPVPPKLHFTDVQLFYKSLKDTEFSEFAQKWGVIEPGLVLNHGQNNLNFKFLGVNLPNPQKVEYSTILEGAESEWSPPSNQNEVRYPQLLPGEYSFKVRTRNREGEWSEEILTADFEILPPFWQTWWFRIVFGVAIFGLIGLVFKMRLNQVRRKERTIRDRLEMEKKLLELEQKALQLQMNPHFIFNALNSIQSLISQKDHKTARYQLAKFSKLMRRILENSRVQAISLENEIETLRNYLTLEQFSRGNSFKFNINISGNTDEEDTFIPPMIIQPFVENAIIHGVANLETEGEISIDFEAKENYIECSVKDNGIGREKAKELKSQVEHQHKSVALEVIRERLSILGDLGLDNLFFEDIYLENGQPGGTRVLIRLPLLG